MSQYFKDEMSAQNMAPLILHESLAKSSFTDYLGSGFKIRESQSTPKDSIILPRSGVAILLVYVARTEMFSLTSKSENRQLKDSSKTDRSNKSRLECVQDLTDRIEAFHKSHQGAIIVVVSGVFGEEEMELVTSHLLLKLLPRPPLFLLAHGEAQAASHVQLIAKVTQMDMRKVIKARIMRVLEKVTLQGSVMEVARAMAVSSHDASVLLDTFGSIGAVAGFSAEEIHQNTPLEKEIAISIFQFLSQDKIDKD